MTLVQRRRALICLLTLGMWATALTACGNDGNVTMVLPFPDGSEISIRLPADVANESTHRELDFYVRRDSLQALVVVTDDREERKAAASGESVSVTGMPTSWRFVRGEDGLADRIILPTTHWAMVIGIPEGLEDLEDAALLVSVVERDGWPVIELHNGTQLAYPRREQPTWFYSGPRGEWALAAISSCEDRPRMISETSLEWCDVSRGLHLHAFGDKPFVDQIRESLEIIVPFVDSGAAEARG